MQQQAEHQRLEELQSLQILDTASEERYDRITRLAQRLFEVPISLVTLVDRDRQWFKSVQGLELRETPREQAFCAHAIQGDDPMQVPDALSDPRFASNPLVTGDPNIRFYAGVPIAAPSGAKLGTLCVIDRQPRELQPEDLASLKDLVRLVEDEIASQNLVTSDELTGLLNRRGFMLLGEQIVAMARRADQPVAVAYVDLDNMKQINDHFGHAAGDQALRLCADIFRSTFRSADVIARLGGDEFAVLFPRVESGVDAALARLAEKVTSSSQDGIPLSLSVGIAVAEVGAATSLDDLLDEADQRMYQQKQDRRRDRSGAER